MPSVETRTWLSGFGRDVLRLPEAMQRHIIDEDIIQRFAYWIEEVAGGFAQAQPRIWR